MAKLLFLENRGKTTFWEQVACALEQQGHTVAWMVQSPVYLPSLFRDSARLHLLPFPSAAELRAAAGSSVSDYPELVTDRGRHYFGAGTAHYGHYRKCIRDVLRKEAPDVVIGEPTLFHELISIALCREAGIPYLHPCGTRYPSGRFMILAYDTQCTVGGSGERLPEAEARELALQIAEGRVIPSYMQKGERRQRLRRQALLLLARARVWWGRLRGECYNTPALLTKLRLAWRLRQNLKRWVALAKVPMVPTRTLLYPLQMQPEANIDVWGRPYSDQAAFVRELLACAPADVQVAIKANPKSKYEVSEELLALAISEPRVCLLPLDMGMAAAQSAAVGTVTVTGTVGYEAVFGKGRALSLRHPLIKQEFPALHADSIAEAVRLLLEDPAAGRGGSVAGERLLQHFCEASYAGLVSEPLYDERCMDPDNVSRVAQALQHILSHDLPKKLIP